MTSRRRYPRARRAARRSPPRRPLAEEQAGDEITSAAAAPAKDRVVGHAAPRRGHLSSLHSENDCLPFPNRLGADHAIILATSSRTEGRPKFGFHGRSLTVGLASCVGPWGRPFSALNCGRDANQGGGIWGEQYRLVREHNEDLSDRGPRLREISPCTRTDSRPKTGCDAGVRRQGATPPGKWRRAWPPNPSSAGWSATDPLSPSTPRSLWRRRSLAPTRRCGPRSRRTRSKKGWGPPAPLRWCYRTRWSSRTSVTRALTCIVIHGCSR